MAALTRKTLSINGAGSVTLDTGTASHDIHRVKVTNVDGGGYAAISKSGAPGSTTADNMDAVLPKNAGSYEVFPVEMKQTATIYLHTSAATVVSVAILD